MGKGVNLYGNMKPSTKENVQPVEVSEWEISKFPTFDELMQTAEVNGMEEVGYHLASTRFTANITTRPIMQRWLINIGNTGCLDLGGRSAVQAPQKSGKSFLSTILCAVVAGAEFGSVRPGLREYEEEEGMKADGNLDVKPRIILNSRILYIDTEQSVATLDALQRRIYALLNIPQTKRDARIWVESIMDLPLKERMKYIECRLHVIRPCFVVIDGITDLMSDINSFPEAGEVSEWVTRMAKKYNCHILTVIHENYKGAGEGNARGAIGTELRNRASIVFKVRKENDIFKVTEDVNRNKPTGGFDFILDNHALPTPYQAPPPKAEASEVEKLNVIESLFSDALTHTYTEIVNALMTGLGVKERAAKGYVAEMTKSGIFTKNGKLYDYGKPF